MFPKKPERFVSDAALHAYREEHHARCELLGCGGAACGEPHHLIPRARGRDDSPSNLLQLCPHHHFEWHTIGGRRWYSRHFYRLKPDARGKVERALRIEPTTTGG